MTVVIVQCRLSSTRLPEKALKLLGGKPTLSWTLDAMKKVSADRYFLACDTDSASKLFPIAEKCGWETFAGPCEDVLKRFCQVIEITNADIVLRATADNPFLFYEAAQLLEDEFVSKYKSTYDYMTFSGLPHGSGIEIYNAKSLLKAQTLTSLSYDKEHVGPSIYNHPESFKSLFLPSPKDFYYPDFRTTIDNFADYKRAENIVDYLANEKSPYKTNKIIEALNIPYIKTQILFVPSVKKGRGTGHLKRCLSLATKLHSFVYIPNNKDLKECENLILEAKENGLKQSQIISDFPTSFEKEYSLIVSDLFCMTEDEAKFLSSLGSLLCIDEGSSFTQYADYLLDIIPSYNLKRNANFFENGFIEMPKNKKSISENKNISNVLITLGGEDPANLSLLALIAFSSLGYKTTIISSNKEKLLLQIPNNLKENITVLSPVPNLKESLYLYDLVVTHYGLTAFEASNAGSKVLLLGTSKLHEKLSKKYGFICLKKSEIKENKIKKILQNPDSLFKNKFTQTSNTDILLSEFIEKIASGKKLNCPLCNKTSSKNKIVARTKNHTFCRCNSCKMIYMSFTVDSAFVKYEKSYFADEYKNQYGRTYLEDFNSIKTQGIRRMKNISSLYKKNTDSAPKILDIGCAYGPCLSAAKDFSWNVYGSDIAKDAIDYVKNALHFNAVNASFADFDSEKVFGLKQFDAISMWYVIEHIQNLSKVLLSINSKLVKGGILAISTPSAFGVSALFNKKSFFENSPKDHYTLWEISKTKKYLVPYGFKVLKIVSTGHHAERMPIVKKFNFLFPLMNIVSKIFSLGDTYEIYCKKIKDAK